MHKNMICDFKMVPLSMWPTLWNKMAFSRPEGFQTGVKRFEGSHKGVLEKSMKKKIIIIFHLAFYKTIKYLTNNINKLHSKMATLQNLFF